MDDSMVDAGRSVSELAQTFASITTLARQSQVAPQRTGTASAGAQKPEASAETRQKQPSKELVQEVEFANSIAKFLNQKVSFSYDKRIEQIVVKITRGNTDEVIRQIPTEEMIKMMTKFRKDFRGLIFDRAG
jgi:flagellar protein FlaG